MSSPTQTLREADKRLQLAYSSGPEERKGKKGSCQQAPHAVNKQRAQESRSISQLQTGMTPPSCLFSG